MTMLTTTPMTMLDASEARLAAALEQCGWQPAEPGRWHLRTGASQAILLFAAHRDPWRQFFLSGGAIPPTSPDRMLSDNAHLPGPAKFVLRDDRTPAVRLDISDAAATASSSAAYTLDHLSSEFAAENRWAQAITACVNGQPQPAAVITQPHAIIAEIKHAGRTASLEEESIHVHLQLPGIYRKVTLEVGGDGEVNLTTVLVELTEYNDVARTAVMLMVRAANQRLPLVRFVHRESEQPPSIRAEVCFGRALIPGGWLRVSLQAIEHAIALTARELEALRDPALAELVLAAAAA